MVDLLIQESKLRKVISAVCSLFLKHAGVNVSAFRNVWEKDFGSIPDNKEWEKALKHMGSIFICNKTRETKYKIVQRLHCTPYILNKIDLQRSSICSKCKSSVGTHSHMFWFCPLISRFWSQVQRRVENIYGYTICKDPWLFILGLVHDNSIFAENNFILSFYDFFKYVCIAM